MPRPLFSLSDMHTLAKKRGGTCLSTEYLGSLTALEWQCKKGHTWNASPNNIQQGSWCPTCAGVPHLSLSDMHTLAKKRGGRCLSSVYVNKDTKLDWQCKKGHTWNASPNNIRQGSWCPTCAGKLKHTLSDMHALAKERGGRCLSSVYVNKDTKLEWQCKVGHTWNTSPNNIRQGSWCPTCARTNRKPSTASR